MHRRCMLSPRLQVLAIIASHLDGAHLVSCLLSCKRMLEAAAEAAVTIRVGKQARDLGTEGLDAVVAALAKYYKGTRQPQLASKRS
jgi:hypothetical protein